MIDAGYNSKQFLYDIFGATMAHSCTRQHYKLLVQLYYSKAKPKHMHVLCMFQPPVQVRFKLRD
jgi:hypothetical protein